MTRLHLLAGAAALALVATACVVPYDFDGDGKADLAAMASDGVWYRAGESAPIFTPVGGADEGALPVAGDYDGDGNWEPATSTINGWETDGPAGTITWFPWTSIYPPQGCAGSILPLPANYDGGNDTDPAWISECDMTWYIEGQEPIQFGLGADQAGEVLYDVAVPADYDGDGIDDIAVYRPTDGTFRVMDVGIVATMPIGIPVPGDYNGDGVDDAAVYVPYDDLFYIDGFVDPVGPFDGSNSSMPIAADYIDTRADDPALFDSSTGTYLFADAPSVVVPNTTDGYPSAMNAVAWGAAIRIIYLANCLRLGNC